MLTIAGRKPAYTGMLCSGSADGAGLSATFYGPCGIACGAELPAAAAAAIAADAVSAFGGVLAFNRAVDAATVEALGELFGKHTFSRRGGSVDGNGARQLSCGHGRLGGRERGLDLGFDALERVGRPGGLVASNASSRRNGFLFAGADVLIGAGRRGGLVGSNASSRRYDFLFAGADVLLGAGRRGGFVASNAGW